MAESEKLDLNAEVSKQVREQWTQYQKLIYTMSLDGPIEMLCLPQKINQILIDAGCVRVYDMVDRDFSEIERLSEREIALVSARLDEFLSML